MFNKVKACSEIIHSHRVRPTVFKVTTASCSLMFFLKGKVKRTQNSMLYMYMCRLYCIQYWWEW